MRGAPVIRPVKLVLSEKSERFILYSCLRVCVCASQYDSLETTSNVISGIFAMATAVGEAPAITSVSYHYYYDIIIDF